MSWRVIHGDSLEALAEFEENSIDSMVTDPPAGISFMGKTWDHDHSGRDGWVRAFAAIFAECLRVLKPGAHALVWALPRTSHWTATALEDAGFEIRDIVTHHFGTGFPKSKNLNGCCDCCPVRMLDEQSGASRFFYCAKPSTAERNIGLDGERNKHPTVKSSKLMAYFCRMVTPPGGTVLDPFCGSGSTGMGAEPEGFDFIGIEKEGDSVAVAEKRIAATELPLFADK